MSFKVQYFLILNFLYFDETFVWYYGTYLFCIVCELVCVGPTDLSMKPTKPLLSHKLSGAEMAAVRQLITGYRESAAFLLRSAEELEQLLMQQP